MKKILLTLILAASFFSGLFLLNSGLASAIDCSNPTTAKDQLQCGACGAAGATTCDPSGAPGTLDSTITTVVNILSVVVGIVAVIMIIIGGFRYITSAGNAESIKNARNTIVYALIGLIIVALAQIIVKFVLNNTDNSTQTPTSSTSPPSPSSASPTTPTQGSHGNLP